MANSKNVGRAGLGLKYLGVRKDGKKWWSARLYWIDPRSGKTREKEATFQADSKALAMQVREVRLAEAKAEVAGLERKRFRDASAAYLETVKVHATKLGALSHVRTLDKHFGEWWLDQVTTRAMQDYLDGLTIASVNNLRNALVGVFRAAMRQHMIDHNPAKAVERRRERPLLDADGELVDGPVRSFTPEQVAVFFDYLEEHEVELYPLVHLQYMLGCRFGEVTALRRTHIDLESGAVRIRRGQTRGQPGQTKGKRARVAGLPLETRALLRAHLDRMAHERWPGWDDLVFPRPVTGRRRPHNYWAYQTIAKKLHKAFTALQLEVKGTTHVARHTMITLAGEITQTETSAALLREMVGHRSQKQHAVYQHPLEGKVLQMGERVGRVITSGRRTLTGTLTGTSKDETSGEG